MSKFIGIGYSLRDVCIVPAVETYVESRKQCDPMVEIFGEKRYPIFVAPMGAVTDENNYKTWVDNKLTPVIPRSVSQRLKIYERLELAKETFVSFSLGEAEEIAYNMASEDYYDLIENPHYICIDLANGHMDSLIYVCKVLKAKYPLIVIMTGNIANPITYLEYAKVGIDYVRVSIGSGSRCTTSANVGVHYALATLLDEINELRKPEHKTKVIADGGIYNFDDINKCLALGADFVMLGRVFAECEEACGEVLYSHNEGEYMKGISYTEEEYRTMIEKLTPYREYYGMSTRVAQKNTGGCGNKTAEGISRPVEVKYPVAKWVSNMDSYLRSAMSYTGSFTIDEFRDEARLQILGGGDGAYRK